MTNDALEPIAPDAAMTLYLDHRQSEVSEQTLSSHRYRLKAFVQWCEDNEIHNLNELTGRDPHAYRVDRRENGDLAPISLQTQLSTLRVFIGFCASIDAVPDGLRSKILLPTVPGEQPTSQTKLGYDRADAILDHLSRYHYASRDHVIFSLLWHTGMRSGTLRSFDLDDYDQEDAALDAVHRPNQDTPLKNGTSGERMDVSPKVLDRHYDRRTKREQMQQRRKYL